MYNIIKGMRTSQSDEHEIIDSNERSQQFIAGLHADKINNVGGGEDAPSGPVIKNILPPEVERAIKEQAGKILEHAKEEERHIKEQALKEAKIQKKKILDDAREEGYKDGYNSGIEELQLKEAELLERMHRNQAEYEELVDDLEPAFAGLIVKYVEKLTGVVLEDKIPIIGYLMRRAIMDANPSKHYYIRVSPEDMEDAMKEEEELKSIIDVKAELEIIEDATLSRGDCHVEMDSCVVDSGLGVRMEILKENLKLLVEEE